MGDEVSKFVQGDLKLVNLTKEFGDFTAVDDLTLTIPKGSTRFWDTKFEFVTLFSI